MGELPRISGVFEALVRKCVDIGRCAKRTLLGGEEGCSDGEKPRNLAVFQVVNMGHFLIHSYPHGF